jgi:hypothetical protein
MKKIILLLLFIPLLSFGQETIETKYNPPEGYERIFNDGYSKFLRQFPLKDNNRVKFHHGGEKTNNDIWDAVFDYDIGKGDLHQCADAVLYMRANFLFKQGLTENLYYNFVSGFKAKYSDYMTHYYKIEGNNVSLVSRNNILKDNPETLRKWLRQIFSYANTWSIDTYDSSPVNILEMKPGDFFIESNPPPATGHAINVVDVVVNKTNSKKMYMLSQSYMPAQETHILINPLNGGVWYTLDEFKDIVTPEWTFTVNQLKRFHN